MDLKNTKGTVFFKDIATSFKRMVLIGFPLLLQNYLHCFYSSICLRLPLRSILQAVEGINLGARCSALVRSLFLRNMLFLKRFHNTGYFNTF